MTARSQSCSAPATISLADAESYGFKGDVIDALCRALGQEESCHLDGGVEHPAAVAAQVENERLYALQFPECLAELAHGGASETVYLDISGLFIYTVCRVDGVERYVVSRDGEVHHLGRAATRHPDLHNAAARAAQQRRHLAALDTHYVAAVHLHYAVVGLQPDGFGRALDDGVDDDDRIVVYVVLDAYAAELAVERLVLAAHLLLVEVYRVRVEILEHAPYGILDQRLHIHLVYIRGIEIAVEPV